MIEPETGTDLQLSSQTPLYVSKRSFKNLWQQYRIYPDRVELECWIGFHTLKIPLRDIVDVKVRSLFSRKDSSWGGFASLCGLKIDLSDLCRHIAIKKKSGWIKFIVFTPDNPDEFADIMKMLIDKADQIKSLMKITE
jgi:hypothetical protein